MQPLKLTWVVACTLLVSPAAQAHDFWVEPASFTTTPGSMVAIGLRVGHELDVKTIPRQEDRIVRFEAIGPAGRRAVLSAQTSTPAGRVELTEPGVHTIVYQSNHAFIELAAEAFDSYLEHEGLTSIAADRRARGETKVAGRESYARYAKALVQVGQDRAGFDRVVGLPIEIVATHDPVKADVARFRVTFHGKPLAGARVDLLRLDDLTDGRHTQTDGDGKLEIPLSKAGRYMVATTHMVRAPNTVRGDWESFWATLTFEVGK